MRKWQRLVGAVGILVHPGLGIRRRRVALNGQVVQRPMRWAAEQKIKIARGVGQKAPQLGRQRTCHTRELNPERPACALAPQGTHPRSTSTQVQYGSNDTWKNTARRRAKSSPTWPTTDMPYSRIKPRTSCVCPGASGDPPQEHQHASAIWQS